MVIDVDKIRDEFAQAHQEAVSLSIEAAYVTLRTFHKSSKASQYARSLSVESGFMTDETKEQILQKQMLKQDLVSLVKQKITHQSLISSTF